MIQLCQRLVRPLLFGVAVVLFMLPVSSLRAAPVRVVTWDLQARDASDTPSAGHGLPDDVGLEAFRVLKQLNPDIIVLQNVPDASTCDDLAAALLPAEFHVAVLSNFRDATGAVTSRQTAILARGQGLRPRWDVWKSLGAATSAPGGFAGAVVRLDGRDIAVFAVQLSDGGASGATDWESRAQQLAREDAALQLLDQINALGGDTNAPMPVIVAGDFYTAMDDPKLSGELTLSQLDRARFVSAFVGIPAERRITLPSHGNRGDATVDYLYARDAGKAVNVQVARVVTTLHSPVAGDLDFAAAAAVPTPADNAVSAPATAPVGQSLLSEIGQQNVGWLAGLLVGGIALVSAGMIILSRRPGSRPPSGAQEASPPGGGLSMLSPPNAGEILVMARATQTQSAVRAGPAAQAAPVVHVQGEGWSQSGTEAAEWRRRAEQAERRADKAAGALRAGLLPQLAQWLKGSAARQLVADREQLLEAQLAAAAKMQKVDERLTKVELQIQQRTREYEMRITELEKELVAAREENRELIRAKIAQVRAEMERERARLRQQTQFS